MADRSLTQMQLMMRSAKERLRETDITDIVRNAGVRVSENTLRVDSLSREYSLRLPSFEFEQTLGMWHHLTLLQYLFTADGSPLSGRWISLSDMPGGLSRGYGFDKDIGLMFERDLSGLDAAAFTNLCEELGSKTVDGRADASVVVMYAPRFPILINFWESDDEFPCSGKLFVDANAHHYLTIEAAGGACAAVVARLIELKAATRSDGSHVR